MAKRDKTGKRRGAPAAAARPPAPPPRPSRPPLLSPPLALALAAAAALAFFFAARWTAQQPWSYDEYYHLGLARLMRTSFRVTSFHWTPFSLAYDHFADKEPLFHLLLMPFAGLSLERAGLAGALLGQLFLIGVFAGILWKLKAPGAPWLLLALAGLGPMFALRVDMCRPHVWLIGFSLLALGLLAALPPETSWKALLPVAALAGLAHAGGWITVGFAALWGVAGLLSRVPSERRIEWRPAAGAAAGWLSGQLVHPNVPENFRLLWLVNAVIPFQSTAGDAALRAQLGNELTPPELPVLVDQWAAFIAPALVAVLLFGNPRLRTRSTVTAALAALAFLFAGTFFLRRFFELGAPLALLALALVLRERKEQGLPPLLPRAGRLLAALGIALAAVWTWSALRVQGFGETSPPREMAAWMAAHGQSGERVFTAQWADSAPLFYTAPQVQSLVALDPTLFWVKSPHLFAVYAQIVEGRHPAPARAIRDSFGARWVTIWKQPTYRRLAEQLAATPGALIPFNTPEYLIFDLSYLSRAAEPPARPMVVPRPRPR